MFVYSSFCNTEMILNAGSHDNIARFTRKSCCPNAEVIIPNKALFYQHVLK